MSFTKQFLAEVQQVTAQLNEAAIEKCADELAAIRERGGRLFILGVGGSAGNAGHAVNDFRKICGFEAYAPTDNVSELTARTNDEGWATVFSEWLKGSRINAKDGLLIFSVGGGNLEKNVSPNLVSAIQVAKSMGASVIGIVGRDGGYTAKEATACVIVPTVNPNHVTPHSEAFQGVVWHLFVSHPKTQSREDKVGKHKVKRAVFLDRDGVINRALERDGFPYAPTMPDEFEIYPEVPAACAKLKAAGFLLVVATNQPDVGRGTMKQEIVEAIHAEMCRRLPLDRVEVCYHPGHGDSECDCRKPKPGMLLHAGSAMNIDLAQSWMVGDRWRDIDCGHAAGCKTVLIDRHYKEALRQSPDFSARNLAEAVDIIRKQFE